MYLEWPVNIFSKDAVFPLPGKVHNIRWISKFGGLWIDDCRGYRPMEVHCFSMFVFLANNFQMTSVLKIILSLKCFSLTKVYRSRLLYSPPQLKNNFHTGWGFLKSFSPSKKKFLDGLSLFELEGGVIK